MAAGRRSWWDHCAFLLALVVAGLAGFAAWGTQLVMTDSRGTDAVQMALACAVAFFLLVAVVHWIRRDHVAWVVTTLLLVPGMPVGVVVAGQALR
jgi:hypothetical protein